ncbi:MAG: FecR domain-containing protein [Chitinophagaceae bacterium]
MPADQLEYLIYLYFTNSITDGEKEELLQAMSQLSDEDISRVLEKAWMNYKGDALIPAEVSDNILNSIFHKAAGYDSTGSKTPVVPIKRRWIKIATAAACVLLIAAGTYFFFPAANKPQAVAKKEIPVKRTVEDVKPGEQKAVLVLADGSQILLDSASNGVLAQQGDAQIIKRADGAIAYNLNGNTNAQALYNTISTPAGGIYQLVLPDGSKAWLNAKSSIRYPTEFSTAERRVQISGEVYFEVAKNAAKPFIVKVNDLAEVRVLGTHFNVNAYQDEAEIKTTLLEGAVNISMGADKCLLIPGQQAKIDKKGKIKRVNDADLDEAVAWKNGSFLFNSSGLEQIFRQVSRWYNLQIVYEGKIPDDKFSGRISRSINLASFLKYLRWSDIHFVLDGDKLIVKS